jgi:hypothetical protein
MIRKNIFSIFIILASTYILLASHNGPLLEKPAFSITTEQLHAAEKRLNQDLDPNLYEDTLLILKYLESRGFSDERVSSLFKSTPGSVRQVLKNPSPCPLLSNIHVYYFRGGVSVSEIEQEEQHSNFINWLTRFIPCLRPVPPIVINPLRKLLNLKALSLGIRL